MPSCQISNLCPKVEISSCCTVGRCGGRVHQTSCAPWGRRQKLELRPQRSPSAAAARYAMGVPTWTVLCLSVLPMALGQSMIRMVGEDGQVCTFSVEGGVMVSSCPLREPQAADGGRRTQSAITKREAREGGIRPYSQCPSDVCMCARIPFVPASRRGGAWRFAYNVYTLT